MEHRRAVLSERKNGDKECKTLAFYTLQGIEEITSQALHFTTSIPPSNSPSSFDRSSVKAKDFRRRRDEMRTRIAYTWKRLMIKFSLSQFSWSEVARNAVKNKAKSIHLEVQSMFSLDEIFICRLLKVPFSYQTILACKVDIWMFFKQFPCDILLLKEGEREREIYIYRGWCANSMPPWQLIS